MNPDTDWQSIAEKALTELEADKKAVRGAALRLKIDELSNAMGAGLTQYLTSLDLKFGDFLESVPNVKIRKVHGSDMFVGLNTLTITDEELLRSSISMEFTNIRKDVYDAFTQAGRSFSFVPKDDRFIEGSRPDGSSIHGPTITPSILIARRSAYAAQIRDDTIREQLIESLGDEPNALSRFSKAVRENSLTADWHEHNNSQILDEIREWCSTNGVDFNPKWESQTVDSQDFRITQRLFRTLLRHMSDDEVRGLNIPFTAVEKLFAELQSKRR